MLDRIEILEYRHMANHSDSARQNNIMPPSASTTVESGTQQDVITHVYFRETGGAGVNNGSRHATIPTPHTRPSSPPLDEIHGRTDVALD